MHKTSEFLNHFISDCLLPPNSLNHLPCKITNSRIPFSDHNSSPCSLLVQPLLFFSAQANKKHLYLNKCSHDHYSRGRRKGTWQREFWFLNFTWKWDVWCQLIFYWPKQVICLHLISRRHGERGRVGTKRATLSRINREQNICAWPE